MPVEFLIEELPDADASLGEPPARFLQLGFRRAVGKAFAGFSDPFLEGKQGGGGGVVDQAARADAELAGWRTEPAGAFHALEKVIEGCEGMDAESHPLGVGGCGEQALVGARVVEPVELEAEAALREVQSELASRDILERMRFVDDKEIIWEEEAVAAGQRLGFLGGGHEREEERVVEHDDVGLGDLLPGLLVEARAEWPRRRGRCRRAVRCKPGPRLWGPGVNGSVLSVPSFVSVAHLAIDRISSSSPLVKRSPAWRMARPSRVGQR